MTDKSAVELSAIGQVFPSVRLLCDFHSSLAWERWVSMTSIHKSKVSSGATKEAGIYSHKYTNYSFVVESSVLIQVGVAI